MASSTFLLVALLALFSVGSTQECPPEGVSFLPHPDCTKYIICDNGQGVTMDCPPALYYNPALEQCDFPSNVPECVGGTRPPVGGSTTTPTPTSPSTTEPPTEITPEPTTTEIPEPTTTEVPEPGVLTRCGDTITADSGRIHYKPNQSYKARELCSFVIRVSNNSGIVFTLDSHGINATSDPNAINIFTFSEVGLIDSVHMGPPNPLTQVYASGALAVVVFKTTGNRGTGFKLSFEGVGRTAYSSGVELVFGSLSGGQMVVPSWPNFSGTTNALVFSGNHEAVIGLEKLRLIISEANFYTCGSIQNCGCDAIRVFEFVSDKATEEGLFCDQEYHRSIYETRGIFIIIFRKFYDGAWGKAKLTWTANQNELTL